MNGTVEMGGDGEGEDGGASARTCRTIPLYRVEKVSDRARKMEEDDDTGHGARFTCKSKHSMLSFDEAKKEEEEEEGVE